MTRIYLSPPHASGRELELVTDAFESNWIAPLGPHVDAFEREFAAAVGVPHAARSLERHGGAAPRARSCSASARATRCACSTLTFSASANAITLRGRAPVFVDCRRGDLEDGPRAPRRGARRPAPGGRPRRRVIAVDLYGQCGDYDAARARSATGTACRSIEDAAEALGATYRGAPAGGQGALAVFSFNGNKIITTSGGGMLVSGNADWIEHARALARRRATRRRTTSTPRSATTTA